MKNHFIRATTWGCPYMGMTRLMVGRATTLPLYQFFKGKFPAERKFYDLIPPLLEKKYLKTIYD